MGRGFAPFRCVYLNCQAAERRFGSLIIRGFVHAPRQYQQSNHIPELPNGSEMKIHVLPNIEILLKRVIYYISATVSILPKIGHRNGFTLAGLGSDRFNWVRGV